LKPKKMKIYAAMVDDLDKYSGTVLESLKPSGDFENTFNFFMSTMVLKELI
jgi:arylsulfatase A-like enzyme